MENEMIKTEDGSWEMKSQEDETARLERAGMLDGLAKTKVLGLPIGAAATGLAAAGIGDIISGFISGVIPTGIAGTWTPAITKLLMAWLIKSKTISGFIGSTAADTGALIFTIDAVTDIVNLRGMVGGLLGGAGAQLGQTMKGTTVSGNGHKEVSSIAEYNRLMGIA